jgi:hypothetical protein
MNARRLSGSAVDLPKDCLASGVVALFFPGFIFERPGLLPCASASAPCRPVRQVKQFGG